MFFILVLVLFVIKFYVLNNFFTPYKHTYGRLRASHGSHMKAAHNVLQERKTFKKMNKKQGCCCKKEQLYTRGVLTPTSHTHHLLTTPTSHTHTFHPLSTIVIHTLNFAQVKSMDDNCGECVNYIDFFIQLIHTLVSVLFCRSIPTFCSLKKMFFVLVLVLFYN